MIRQCFECNTGILFSSAALAETGLDVQTLFPIYVPCKKPIVGPGPKALELWEKGKLPPLKRRSTALGIDEHAHHLREKGGVGNYKSDGIVREEKRRSWLDHDDMFIRGGDGKPSSFEIDLLPEQVEDYFDSVSPINDMLSIAKAWYVHLIFILSLFTPLQTPFHPTLSCSISGPFLTSNTHPSL